jgi:cold shock CspA family protein
MPTGTIVRARSPFDFCFIAVDGGGSKDVFAHRSAFGLEVSLADPQIVGSRVEFEIQQTPKGPQAQRCQIIFDDDKAREHGRIEKTMKDFGFLIADRGEQLFFHNSELIGIDWPPAPGMRLTYNVAVDKAGKRRAVAIRQES